MQSFPPPAYVVRPEILVELAYHQVSFLYNRAAFRAELTPCFNSRHRLCPMNSREP